MPFKKRPTKIPTRIEVKRIKTRGTSTLGRYRELLPEKKPRNFKKMKHPLEVFSNEYDKQRIKSIFNEFYREKPIGTFSNFDYKKIDPNTVLSKSIAKIVLTNLKTKLIKNYGGDIFKNQGKELHVFLPLTGMGIYGYFYKAVIENILPKARITFLVTPKHIVTNEMVGKFYDILLNNFKSHLQRSLNKNDKHFIVIDYINKYNTINIINSTLSKIYSKEIKADIINSPEGKERIQQKDWFAKAAVPYSSFLTTKIPDQAYPSWKKEIKLLTYTYYYIGNKFMQTKDVKKLFEMK